MINHLYEVGAETPQEVIVILHAAGSSPQALVKFSQRLSEKPKRRIIVPSLPPCDDPIPAFVKIAHRCLDLYPAQRRVLIGHSMGGLVACLTALERSDLAALIAFEPIVLACLDTDDPDDQAAKAWDAAFITKLEASIAAGDPEAGVSAFIEAWNETPWQDFPEPVRRMLVDQGAGLAQVTGAVTRFQVDMAVFADLKAKTLLLQGETAPEASHRITKNLTNYIPNATRTLVSNCGHMGPVLAAPKVADVIDDFLTQHKIAGWFE